MAALPVMPIVLGLATVGTGLSVYGQIQEGKLQGETAIANGLPRSPVP
jgi:hypothetical protein